ncbi:MAG TPA: hypothetical protein VFQ37_05350, partial [Mycobacterium sp.]|nr:hypothetical protein [Mycobacterium sp.]
IPGLGHPIELRAYRSAGVLHLDWWHDRRRIESATIESLAQKLTTTITTLIQDALTQDETDTTHDEPALVDLSSSDTGV